MNSDFVNWPKKCINIFWYLAPFKKLLTIAYFFSCLTTFQSDLKCKKHKSLRFKNVTIYWELKFFYFIYVLLLINYVHLWEIYVRYNLKSWKLGFWLKKKMMISYVLLVHNCIIHILSSCSTCYIAFLHDYYENKVLKNYEWAKNDTGIRRIITIL